MQVLGTSPLRREQTHCCVYCELHTPRAGDERQGEIQISDTHSKAGCIVQL